MDSLISKDDSGNLPLKPTEAERQKYVDDLFRKHWRGLVIYLRKRFGAGPPEPEEVAQNAFTLISGMKNWYNIQHPKAFLYALAIRNLVHERKLHAQTQDLLDNEFGIFSDEVEEITPERVYMYGETLDLLNEAFEKLPRKYREILILNRVKGQTYVQIKSQLGWSKAEISRSLKQVLTHLRAFRPD